MSRLMFDGMSKLISLRLLPLILGLFPSIVTGARVGGLAVPAKRRYRQDSKSGWRVAHPFGLTGLLRHGCPILLARFWREGGHDFVTTSYPPCRPRKATRVGHPTGLPLETGNLKLETRNCHLSFRNSKLGTASVTLAL